MRKTCVLLVLCVALAVLPAAAQEEAPGPITWIGFSQLNPGKGAEDAVKLLLEDREFMDGLVANGTILSYGAVTPINHHPDDDWNYAEWVTVADWSKVDAWVGSFMGYVGGLEESERMARQERFMDVHAAGSHYDHVVRHLAFDQKAMVPRFFYMAHFTVDPAKSQDVVAMFNDFVKPALEGPRSEGQMGSIGVYSPEIHGEHGYTHVFWYTLSGLGSIDAMQAAFASAAGPGMQAWAQSVFDIDSHWDKILMVLHYGGPETAAE